jgi:hypothetical protein
LLLGLPADRRWRVVQDEADEMLSKGFKEQIYDVYRYLPPETQVRCTPVGRPPPRRAAPARTPAPPS